MNRPFSATIPINLAQLTNDDTKVLGKAKDRNQRLKYQQLFQTNKYNTLNSSWTPLKDKVANQTMFDDRVSLVCNWFEMWNDKQRKWFLLSILGLCRPPQLYYMQKFLNENNIYEARDFTQVLPKYVSLYIYSFLSPRDLSRCAQVNSHWRYLSEQDELWVPKCVRYGWFLPYRPREGEIGAWKFYYILCSMAVSDLPLNKEDADYFRNLLYIRDMTDQEKEDEIYKKNKNERDLNASYTKKLLFQSRQSWLPSSQKANDLRRSSDLLAINNEFKQNKMELIYKNRFDGFYSSLKDRNQNHVQRKNLNEELFTELSRTIPIQMLTMREAYYHMQKWETDLNKINYDVSKNVYAFLNYKKAQRLLVWRTSARQNQVLFLKPIHVLMVSSRVPCANLLLQCVKFGILVIPYEYESTTLESLLALIDNMLENNIAETSTFLRTIGFFVHSETRTHLELLKNVSITKTSVNNEDIRNFFKALVLKMSSKKSKIDLFVPLACSDDGMEIINKIHEATCLSVRAPVGYSQNYNFIKGRWLNYADNHQAPLNTYFEEQKLNVWLNSCDIFQEAHERLSLKAINNYNENLDRITINQIVGRIMQDSLDEIELLSDVKLREAFISMIVKASKSNTEQEFLKALSKEITTYLETGCKKTDGDKNKKNLAIFPLNKNPSQIVLDSKSNERKTSLNEIILPTKEDLMKSDIAFKTFHKFKFNVNTKELGMRAEIVLDFVKSEINYMHHLEIIQNFYRKPLKTCRNSGETIINNGLIDVIFDDVTMFYGISREMVKELLLRLKNWTNELCIVDIMKLFCNYLNAYVNYANNYDTIIRTIDKLVIDNPQFRAFLLHIDQTMCTNMLTIQDLLNLPWNRINEYVYLLNALRIRTPNDHLEQIHIDFVLPQIQDVYLYAQRLKERSERAFKMLQVQKNIVNCPSIIENGRYLVLEQNAILLSTLTYNYVKDIKCFLFTDMLIITFRLTMHFAFVKYSEENLVFNEMIDDLSVVEIKDVSDHIFVTNIILLKTPLKDYYIAFENYELKRSFIDILENTKEVLTKKL